MTPRNVCIFTWGLAGGAFANVAASLARGFLAVGVENVYLLYLSHGPGKNLSLPAEVKTVSLGVSHSAWAPLALARWLKMISPDVLISMPAFVNIAATVGWLLSHRKKTRLIVSEHATMSYKVFVEHRREAKFRLLPSMARLLYPRVSGVAAISRKILDDLTETMNVTIDSRRTCVIPNPLDLERIQRLAGEEVEHPWFTENFPPVILSVGRLAKQKNYPPLIRAFSRIREKMDARLVIIGEGNDERKLRDLGAELGVSDDLELLGFDENPYRFMARADVFVLPSEEEAFGLVLVESMACGTPVIAADAMGGGPRGILDDGRKGLLVPVNDVEALADAIRRVLTVKELRHRLRTEGREHCRRYHPKAIAGEWVDFIQRL